VDPSLRPELMTLADDEAVVFHGPEVRRFDGLAPDTEVDLDGHVVRTLPRRGELLSRIATVNDVHFGETVCGKVDGIEEWATFSVEAGEPPYPETMNAGAVAEIAAAGVDAVVAKGDLTSNGTMAEYERFCEVYGGAFGDRLVHVRGNHESYHELPVAAWPTQERVLPGVTLAVLDTSRDRTVNGHLDAGSTGSTSSASGRTSPCSCSVTTRCGTPPRSPATTTRSGSCPTTPRRWLR
jgi:3',5'-cyclic-AMP phosphodiesterase